MSDRYQNTARTWAPHPTRGWVRVTHRLPNRWDQQSYTEHLSTETDTMVLLAAQTYGDPNLYWGIAEMNPEVGCPDDLRQGEVLQIPAGPR